MVSPFVDTPPKVQELIMRKNKRKNIYIKTKYKPSKVSVLLNWDKSYLYSFVPQRLINNQQWPSKNQAKPVIAKRMKNAVFLTTTTAKEKKKKRLWSLSTLFFFSWLNRALWLLSISLLKMLVYKCFVYRSALGSPIFFSVYNSISRVLFLAAFKSWIARL